MVNGEDVRRKQTQVIEVFRPLTVDADAQIKISAGHKMKISVDPAYAEKCDDKVMFIDYSNLPKVIEEDKPIYVDDGILSFKVRWGAS